MDVSPTFGNRDARQSHEHRETLSLVSTRNPRPAPLRKKMSTFISNLPPSAPAIPGIPPGTQHRGAQHGEGSGEGLRWQLAGGLGSTEAALRDEAQMGRERTPNAKAQLGRSQERHPYLTRGARRVDVCAATQRCRITASINHDTTVPTKARW